MSKIILIKLYLLLIEITNTNSDMNFLANTIISREENNSYTKNMLDLFKRKSNQLFKNHKPARPIQKFTQKIDYSKKTKFKSDPYQNRNNVYWGDSPNTPYNKITINNTDEIFFDNLVAKDNNQWHPDPRFRVYGGRKAKIGQIPYQFLANTIISREKNNSYTKNMFDLFKIKSTQLFKYHKSARLLQKSTKKIDYSKTTKFKSDPFPYQNNVFWGDSPNTSYNKTSINNTIENFFNSLVPEDNNQWHPDPRFRVYGGRKAEIGQIPYQVSIRFDNEHSCGGSIIKENFVLTAAHCMYKSDNSIEVNFRYADPINPQDLMIWAGGIEFGDDLWSKWDVINTVSHDTHDIALVLIDGSFNEAKPHLLKPILLPLKGVSHENEICIISGWGYTSDKPKLSSSLQVAEVEIFPHSKCFQIYRKHLNFGTHLICAGLREKLVDACLGDSGGPLACNNILVGVISMGADCGQPNYPGIYTNVSHHRGWIDIMMRKLDLFEDHERSFEINISLKSYKFPVILLIVLIMYCNYFIL